MEALIPSFFSSVKPRWNMVHGLFELFWTVVRVESEDELLTYEQAHDCKV
jgi:hypothetical protein